MSLPYMNDRSMMRPTVRTRFRGLNHNVGDADLVSALYAMIDSVYQKYYAGG